MIFICAHGNESLGFIKLGFFLTSRAPTDFSMKNCTMKLCIGLVQNFVTVLQAMWCFCCLLPEILQHYNITATETGKRLFSFQLVNKCDSWQGQ
jgi:hypothetical protein